MPRVYRSLRRDEDGKPKVDAVVVPRAAVLLDQFQADLARTREHWA